jgi:hypothetical protein
LLGAIAWATASFGGWFCLASAATASPAPVVRLSTQYAQIGELLHVNGTGWSPVGQTVEIEICGQNARNLSIDCNLANQYTAAIRAGGIFYGALNVRLPPSPCPCVVLVTNENSFFGEKVPITIIGAPTAAVPPQAASGVPIVLSAQIVTHGSVSAWFGGPKAVTLLLRVSNLSSITYESPTLTVNVGRGPNPSNFVVGKTMAPLAPRVTQIERIPVTLPAFTFGDYTVRAQVITGDGNVAVLAGTNSYPWGLFVVLLLILLAATLFIWRRVRRRQERQALANPADDLDASEMAPRPQEAART